MWNLAIADEFPGAMRMDAPHIIPAGSTSRQDINSDWYGVHVNYIVREQ